MTTVLIDNYDSFTYNVYQYLSCQGANVVVHRNDKITLQELEDLQPVNLVISPGPGHPSSDAGISCDAIRHFAGKIPILGICLGEQCMFEVFGGKVSYAGSIFHGKTSAIQHDNRGIFKGVPQQNKVTRYHSLAGVRSTLPDALEITATTGDIIMGVRHRQFTVEGVQFHPESILCENGHLMIQNFLNLKGGTWDENPGAGMPVKSVSSVNEAAAPSILSRIYAQRVKDVQASREVPGQTFEDLEKLLKHHIAPPLQDVISRLRQSKPALISEVKRTTPSKGNIDSKMNATVQARQYAMAGASVISVLTEPKWFRGTIHDMRQVREALESMPNRPCVLRKDFIVDRYQILEARVYGADSVLLIVAMLNDTVLRDLYDYAKSLGMEPLVEVNNAEELSRANTLSAKWIGINNRNLNSFDVDMETINRLVQMVPKDTILCALSGITDKADVEQYVKQGVHAVLVGEALMRAWNVKEFVSDLLGYEKRNSSDKKSSSLIKVCGISSVDIALEAAAVGVDLIGLVFEEESKHKVSIEQAKEIVSSLQTSHHVNDDKQEKDVEDDAKDWFQMHRQLLECRERKPLVVGVFANQSVQYMTKVALKVGLDLIQLNGSEPVETSRYLPVPVIKAFHVENKEFNAGQLYAITQPNHHQYVLLDGLNEKLDWSIASRVVNNKQADEPLFPVILAGGLDAGNVTSAIHKVKPWIVNVSSGVETEGTIDLEKMCDFVKTVKSITF